MSDNFTKIKNNLITSNLSDSDFRVLCYLIKLSKNKIAFPSIRTMSNEINKSTTSIMASLKRLEESNYILKENRFLGNGKKTSNVYLLSDECIDSKTKKVHEEKEIVLTQEQKELLDYDWFN